MPQQRHKPPAQRHKLIAARRRPDDFDPGRRGNFVARLKVARLADQFGQPFHFAGNIVRNLQNALPDRIVAITHNVADRTDESPHAAAHVGEFVAELAGSDQVAFVEIV